MEKNISIYYGLELINMIGDLLVTQQNFKGRTKMSVNFMELVNILFRKMERNGMSAVMLTKGI